MEQLGHKPAGAQALNELLSLTSKDLISVTVTLQTFFLFFQNNLSYFLIIDRLEAP